MMYRCNECGHLFEEGEQSTWSESRGEFWGSPCSEKMSGCPLCKGEYVQVEQCKICEQYYSVDDLVDGICDNCPDEYRYNYELCDKINDNEKTTIHIDLLLASLFTEDEIEDLLRFQLKFQSKYSKIDCIDFINDDKYWFKEQLSKHLEGKNEEDK